MYKVNRTLSLFLIACSFFYACENKDLNEGEEFQPREIHENIAFHFDKISVDGVEYLILEKDNNNPHEGFGFMAFRANILLEKQDTLLAYLRTVQEVQNQILAKVSNKPLEEVKKETELIFLKNLKQEIEDLERLEENQLKSNKKKIK